MNNCHYCGEIPSTLDYDWYDTISGYRAKFCNKCHPLYLASTPTERLIIDRLFRIQEDLEHHKENGWHGQSRD